MFDQAFGIDATVRCKCVEGSEEKWVYASGAETEMHVCEILFIYWKAFHTGTDYGILLSNMLVQREKN